MGRAEQRSTATSRLWVTLCLTTITAVSLIGLTSCSGFSPVGFSSPEVADNVAPELTVVEPNEDLAVSSGSSFIVRWTDTDPDSDALIDIDLIEADGPNQVKVAGGIRENDTVADLFVVNTQDLVLGTYFIRLTIDDGVNSPVIVYATDPEQGNRVQVTITGIGQGNPNGAPRVYVVKPDVNAGVSQNDQLSIVVRPTPIQPGPVDPGIAFHYDPDDDPVDITYLLDLDNDPSNDDWASDDDPGNIILGRELVAAGRFDELNFQLVVDVQEIPIRQDGLPYYIRVTATDGLSVSHSYASGRLYVLKLVEGSASSTPTSVDLGKVGRTLMGARFLGFNPLANLGTKMTTAQDIDNDGADDMVVVAQFGNPRNFGNIGEIYLVFGTQGPRFGGDIAINSVADDDNDLDDGPDDPNTAFNRVRGAVMHPTIDYIPAILVDIEGVNYDDRRIGFAPLTAPYTLGITDVIAIRSVGTGSTFGTCALPELLIGMPHNEYTGSSRDDDTGDNPPEGGAPFCYPDDLPNNYATSDLPYDPDDPTLGGKFVEDGSVIVEHRGGSVAMIYGENFIEGTDVEVTSDGIPCNNNITPPTRVIGLTEVGHGIAGSSDQRRWGAKFNVAIYDYLGAQGFLDYPYEIHPLNAHYGYSVGVLPDVDLNGVDEAIISAPRNEIEVEELLAEGGESHPHLTSRLSTSNVTIFLGQDFTNIPCPEDGSREIPFLWRGSCGTPPERRFLARTLAPGGFTSPNNSPLVGQGWFRVRGEKPTDKLGFAAGAADFNLDGPADLMAGAPFADPQLDTDNNGFPDTNPITDAGTVYIVYLRFPFGNTDLADANFPQFRPPMLRIFGETVRDHLGLKQLSSGDVNRDSVPDVVIASRDYNGQGLVDNGMIAIVNGGQKIDGDRQVTQIATSELHGTIFYGTNEGDWAGNDISVGDFNGDEIPDIMISAPGEVAFLAGEDKPRNGVVYLIFGGQHLTDKVFNLSQVGTEQLPGIRFVSPYQVGTLDALEVDKPIFVRTNDCDPVNDIECYCNPEIEENCVLLEEDDGSIALRSIDDASPERVGFVGDTNGDGFDDIMIGNPTADFVDPSFPATGRRPDAGEVYLIYGNNVGANTLNQ
ncbi:MAG: hypothetical protein HJJLKODD_00097 [Phycisphaerae bacterium]|nr:hypothetical protein [Phycisphaerae bacterium]